MSAPIEFEQSVYMPELAFDKVAAEAPVGMFDALKSKFVNDVASKAADKAAERIVNDAQRRFFGAGTYFGRHPNQAYALGGAAMAADSALKTELGQEALAAGLNKAKGFMGLGGPSKAQKALMVAGALGAGVLGTAAYKSYKNAPKPDPDFDKNNGYGQYYTGSY